MRRRRFAPRRSRVARACTHTLVVAPDAEGRRRMGVNLRLADPDQVRAIPIRRFDGFDAWTELPADGRMVGDMWV